MHMNLNYSTEAHYDYDELVYNEIGPFTSISRHHCFSIRIIDDSDLEITEEDFMVHLDPDPGITRVSVHPNITNITIIDNESELSSISTYYQGISALC